MTENTMRVIATRPVPSPSDMIRMAALRAQRDQITRKIARLHSARSAGYSGPLTRAEASKQGLAMRAER
jgi:hypothetical protein